MFLSTPYVLLRLDGALAEGPGEGQPGEELRRLAAYVPTLDILTAWRGERRAHYLRLPGCAGCAAPPYLGCLPGCCAALVRTRLAPRLTSGGRLTQVRGLNSYSPQRLLAAWPRAQATDLHELPTRLSGTGRLLQRWHGPCTVALLALDTSAASGAEGLLQESGWTVQALQLLRLLPLELAATLLPTRPSSLAPTLLLTAAAQRKAAQVAQVAQVPPGENLDAARDPAALWAYGDDIGALLGDVPALAESLPVKQDGSAHTGEATLRGNASTVTTEVAVRIIELLPAQVATARLLGDALARRGVELGRDERAALVRRLQAEGILDTMPYRGQRGAFRLCADAERKPTAPGAGR